MQDFAGKNIVLGICGGIAACKSVFLARELTRLGAAVRVVLTESAESFVTPLSLQALTGNPVRQSLWDSDAERAMGHIELARWADCLVIAPASANMLAKMAHGLADDLLSTLCLVAEVPVLVCPAMNHSMWDHPATRANAAVLAGRGIRFAGPVAGIQACGEEGMGRMSEPEALVDAIRLLDVPPVLVNRHVVVTAGPTREPVDPVRFLSNHSSGKMGYALAMAARAAGARVTLITGPCDLPSPEGVLTIPVETAGAMHEAVMSGLEDGSVFIGCAAVADFRVKEPSELKISKQCLTSLELVANPDILADVAGSGRAAAVVGFAAQTHDVLAHAREKRVAKKVDMMVANAVGNGLAFGTAGNQVTVLTQSDEISLPHMHKTRLAGRLVAILGALLQNDAQSLGRGCHADHTV